jgi:phosphoribosylformylglycinamidine synthase subunit PurQ / glutaminase
LFNPGKHEIKGIRPMSQPKALILFATGTNRDLDVAQALELSGAQAEIVPLNRLRTGERAWQDYQMLVLAGGFSYADALGAGKLLALDLQAYFADEVNAFVEQGKPVMGICNGFQALVKAGILPGQSSPSTDSAASEASKQPPATLTFNANGHFECRWVSLISRSQTCLWTHDLTGPVYCPIAHGEGNFQVANDQIGQELLKNDQIALVYTCGDDLPANGIYPHNPNGSYLDIAGVCNPRGNVLGLMPHPENHIYPHQHPRWARGETQGSGLPLFINGVRHAMHS